MRRSSFISILTVGLVLTLLAGACSSSGVTERGASASGIGDPTTLPALPASSGSGERMPLWTGAVVTPTSWVSTSLVPTLSVPGGRGAWTFSVSDLSGGKSSFGTKTYAETGASSRVPLGAGLQQGHIYTWTATSPDQQPVGGSFQVDLKQSAAQLTDGDGGVLTGLSSGEASFSWSSHSVSSLPGSVGFGLTFRASNSDQAGMPVGWSLQAVSSSPYRSIEVRDDASVALAALDGTLTIYREGSGSALVPVRTGVGSAVDTSGLAPVLVRNSDGTYAVTSKDSTSVFTLDGDTGLGYLSGVSSTDHPMLGQSWKNGRLQSVTDPVSERSIAFIYGGGDCGSRASGFIEVPEGMLCRVKFWDGSTSSISYVDTANGPTIGRLTDYPEAKSDGARVTDLSWDAAGRIAKTRTPLVANAAASGIVEPSDEQFWTSIAYTASGRVASITEVAPSAGATRCTRTYDNEGSMTQVSDSCFGGRVLTVDFDPTTFFPLRTTNELGQIATNAWDLASGQLLASIDYQGMQSIYRYENGNMVATVGPTKGALDAASTMQYEYDQVFDGQMGATAMRGLDVTYFPSAVDVTADGRQELGPRIGDSLAPSLTINWPSAPVGSGGWSAIMTGTLNVERAGDYRIASNTSTARVSVNNVSCADGGCDALPLASGANSIRVDVRSSESAASIDVVWAGPETGGVTQSIPTSALRPQYGLATTTKSTDPTAQSSPTMTASRSLYANPATGRLSARVNQSGQRAELGYEGGNGGRGGWSRQSSTTGASGATYRFTYWGDKEKATAPCPGASSANQGGAAREVISPGPDGGDGVSSTQWIDTGGRVVAISTPGGVVTCTNYGPDGSPRSVELLNTGSKWRIEFARSIEQGMIGSVSTETKGSEVSTSRSAVDLLGRTVWSIDRFGVETRATYDIRTGEVATQVVTVPGSAAVVTSYTYDSGGALSSVSRDGRTIASITWNPDSSLAKVVYGNGMTVTQSYDDALRTVGRAFEIPSGRYASNRSISAGGSVQTETYASPSAASTFTYSHDDAGRLSAASMTAGVVSKDRSWAWTFDNASNRLTQKVTEAGAVIGDWSYAYNKGSQLVATTDPAASAGIQWDEFGNAIKIGPDTFTYDAGNRLISATDGTITIDYELNLAGDAVSKTTTGGPNSETIRYASGGVILDGSSRAVAQLIDLPGGVRLTAPMSSGQSAKWLGMSLNGNEFVTTDDSGALIGAPQVFDPYGQRLTVPPPTSPGLPSTTWQANTSNETEALATPFQVMGARPYVPALGRFLQPDPKVGGSANQYDFASQDPVNLSDPTGEDVSDWVAPLATAVATIGAIFLFKVSSVKVGLAVGAAIGALGAAISAGLDYASGRESAWTAVRAGYTILAGLAAGGGAAAARNRWVSAAKTKQVSPAAPNEPGPATRLVESSDGGALPGLYDDSVPIWYTTTKAQNTYRTIFDNTWDDGWPKFRELKGKAKKNFPMQLHRAAMRAATKAADKVEPAAVSLRTRAINNAVVTGKPLYETRTLDWK